MCTDVVGAATDRGRITEVVLHNRSLVQGHHRPLRGNVSYGVGEIVGKTSDYYWGDFRTLCDHPAVQPKNGLAARSGVRGWRIRKRVISSSSSCRRSR